MTTEQMSKSQLLIEMQQSFEELEILLASLQPAQMDLPGVCDKWSIKDNIAHLSAWQKHALDSLLAQQAGHSYKHELEGKGFDEQNEYLYQQNKDRSLDDVLTEFRSSYRQLYSTIQTTSEEDLHRPLEWLDGESQMPRIIGNTYEHYSEHAGYIQRWLESQKYN